MNFEDPPYGQDPQMKDDPFQKDEFEERDSSLPAIEELLQNETGFIVGRIGNEFLRLDTDAHLLTTAPTSAGKGTGAIVPNLLAHPGSAFVIDIRGDTVNTTAHIKKLRGQKVVILDPYHLTRNVFPIDTYNPLQRAIENRNARDFSDIMEAVSKALFYKSEEKNGQQSDPIWDANAQDLILGLIRYAINHLPSYKQNLKEVYSVLVKPKDELDLFLRELQFICENVEESDLEKTNLKKVISILSDNETKFKPNAIAQARTYLGWVNKEAFEGQLESSTFSFSELQSEPKTTVYIVIPENYIEKCSAWVRMIIDSAVYSLENVKTYFGKPSSQLSPNERVLFLFDELPLLGKIDAIQMGINTIRGRGANFWLFVQNLAQLKQIYGEEGSTTILANLALIQAFKNDEVTELEYFIKVIGEEFFDVQSVTISESETDGYSESWGESNTISNSQSFSKSSTTSDTINESRGINWGTNKGRSSQKGKSFSKGTSTGSSTGASRGENTNTNKGKNYKRNFIFSDYLNSNSSKGKGTNTNSNWGKQKGSNKQKGYQYSNSDFESNTKGGNQNQGHSSTKSNQEGETYNSGSSETKNHQSTENHSKTRSRNITVKRERMKIETVRTLRDKLNGQNQLLKVKGYQPFFSPKMSYFLKFRDRDQYMFPDLSVFCNFNILKELKERDTLSIAVKKEILGNIQETLDFLIRESNQLEKIRKYPDQTNAVEHLSFIRSCLIDETLSQFEYEDSYEELVKLKAGYDEIGLILAGLMTILSENVQPEYWLNEKNDLLSKMENVQLVIDQLSFPPEYIKLGDLPIKKLEDANENDPSVIREVGWVIDNFLSVFEESISKHISNLSAIKDDINSLIEIDKWLKMRLDRVYYYIYKALEN